MRLWAAPGNGNVILLPETHRSLNPLPNPATPENKRKKTTGYEYICSYRIAVAMLGAITVKCEVRDVIGRTFSSIERLWLWRSAIVSRRQ